MKRRALADEARDNFKLESEIKEVQKESGEWLRKESARVRALVRGRQFSA